MISGELETNGDHWRTLAASLVRLSLSHHDQTSGVRRGQEGPMSPSDPTSVSLSARTHLASGHTCNRTIFLFTRNQPINICLFRIPESALDTYNSWLTLTSRDLTLYCPDRVSETGDCQHFYCLTPSIYWTKLEWSGSRVPFLKHLSETKIRVYTFLMSSPLRNEDVSDYRMTH